LKGKKIGGRTYKVHLDGYDQTAMITGKGESARNEIWYFTESSLAAARIGDWKFTFIDQPEGWFGPKVKLDCPGLTNLRLDPFERINAKSAPSYLMDFFGHNFWRFVFVQQEVARLAQTAIEYPPMQKGASFNLSLIKEKIEKAMANRVGH